MSDNENNEAMKQAVKEALREWLDEKYAAFGRWSLHGILAAGLTGLVYIWSQYGHK